MTLALLPDGTVKQELKRPWSDVDEEYRSQ